MKGLMLKELYITRKYRTVVLVVYLVLIMLCILVKLSAVYGNIAKLAEGGAENVSSVMYYIMVFGGAVLLFSTITDCIIPDEKSGFRVYEHTLPVSERKIVGAVYLTNLCFLGAAAVIAYINLALANLIFDREFNAKYLLYILAIGSVFYAVKTVQETVTYRVRKPKVASAVTNALFMLLYLGAGFGLMNWMDSYYRSYGIELYGTDEAQREAALEALGISDGQVMTRFFQDKVMEKVRWFGDNIWWLAPTVLLGLTAAGYFLSVKALKRRGGRC